MKYYVLDRLSMLGDRISNSVVSRRLHDKKNNVKSKIVLYSYDNELKEHIIANGLEDSDVINVFDFLGGFFKVEKISNSFRTNSIIDKSRAFARFNGDDSKLYVDGRYIADFSLRLNDTDVVKDIYFKDSYGHCYYKQEFNSKGYLARSLDFDEQGNIIFDKYYDVEQDPFLEVAYMNVNGVFRPSIFLYIDKKTQAEYAYTSMFDILNHVLSFLLEPNDEVICENNALLKNIGKLGHNVSYFAHSFDNLVLPQNCDKLIVSLPKLPLSIKSKFKLNVEYQSEYEHSNSLKKCFVSENQILVLGDLNDMDKISSVLNDFTHVLSKFPDHKLAFAGSFDSFEKRDEFFSLINKFSLTKNVIYKGSHFPKKIIEFISESKLVWQLNDEQGDLLYKLVELAKRPILVLRDSYWASFLDISFDSLVNTGIERRNKTIKLLSE